MTRRNRVLGISALVIGLSLSGTALVNAATPTTTITACSNTKTGAVRVVSAKTKCSSKETRLTWNTQGPAGKDGAPGVAGTNGIDGKDGAPGAAGKDGLPGVDGKDGVPGLPGQNGTDGKDGAPGAVGPVGPAGPAADAVDPNPYALTYRVTLGSGGPLEATGFTQEVSSEINLFGSTQGAGRPNLGDVKVTLPMTSAVLSQLSSISKGTPQSTMRVEMCRPGELSPQERPDTGFDTRVGRCTLQLDLTDVFLSRVAVKPGPAGSIATLHLVPKTEKVTSFSESRAASVLYDVAKGTSAVGGGGSATSTNDTRYNTTLSSAAASSRGVVSTESWSQGVSSETDYTSGTGAAVGRPNFDAISAKTRSGSGTVALLSQLTRGAAFTGVEIVGCETDVCTQRVSLGTTYVSKVVLGAPTLLDETELVYETIQWDRSDGPRDSMKTYKFNIRTGVGG